MLKDIYLYLRLGDGERRRRGGEGERRLRTGEGDRLFLNTQTLNDELSVWHCGRTPRQIIQVDFPDLGETSLCRRLGEGVRLRLLLTSPFLALGPDFGLLGPSSSEEEDPESNIKETHHQKKRKNGVPVGDERVFWMTCTQTGMVWVWKRGHCDLNLAT